MGLCWRAPRCHGVSKAADTADSSNGESTSSQTSTEKRCLQRGRDSARDGHSPPHRRRPRNPLATQTAHGPLRDVSPSPKAVLSTL